MESLLQLHEDVLEDPGVAVGLIDLDAGRSTQKPDGPLSQPDDVFATADGVLPVEAHFNSMPWATDFPGLARVPASPTHGLWASHPKSSPHHQINGYAMPLEPAPPAYYRTASWPATVLPHPPLVTAMSVPPPLSPGGQPHPDRRASMPAMEPWVDPALLDGSVHGSVDGYALGDAGEGSSHGRRQAISSDADTPTKVPLSNIAAMMTGINMGNGKGGRDTGVKSAKGPLKDPPRNRGSSSKSARERMLQQNRASQAKYRERQKQRALQMASELATKRQQNAALLAAIEDRDATIAMLRSQLASAEAGEGVPRQEMAHAHSTLLNALVQVRALLDAQQLWIPIEAGGLGVAPPGLHVLLQGTANPMVDVNETVHAAVAAHLHFSHQRLMQRRDALSLSIQPMQPMATASLLTSWRALLHQLQLTPSQHTIVKTLARNAVDRLHAVQHRRAQLAQELSTACLTALTAQGDKAATDMAHHDQGTPEMMMLDTMAVPVSCLAEPRAVQLLQSMEATWAEQAQVMHESTNLLLRRVLNTVQSARLLVAGYPDKCNAVQLGLVLMALPSPAEAEAGDAL